MRPATPEMMLARWLAGDSVNGIAKRYRLSRTRVELVLQAQGVDERRRQQRSGTAATLARRERWAMMGDGS